MYPYTPIQVIDTSHVTCICTDPFQVGEPRDKIQNNMYKLYVTSYIREHIKIMIGIKGIKVMQKYPDFPLQFFQSISNVTHILCMLNSKRLG